mmetsp:Transcript_43206/g.119485  ORF Transcript_43206/g.119485 Transcript_43206/m.119485 type:complete len:117 (-) Transcript_43206:151-501(-)|eukprot:CAMPEP_0117552810 /NCGR_PEP_ID=MMETSP0784-20121206/49900_1 /TAXON_ID=39447 /ORGANISM="" /LENGTH=116 /DNA_ID=CAMNT_0005349895 /DNA_START=74 /DNA_END=424 /DNA_ORIENTATION=-
MKISVCYGSTPDVQAELEVALSDTVKSVKKQVIALDPPPGWANTSLLMPQGTTDYLDNKRSLASYGVTEGAVLKFAYARKLSTEEKLELNLNGVKTEDFEVPPFTMRTYPIGTGVF